MSRNGILATGAVLWTVVAVDGFIHLASGDWIAAALMATVGTACVAWVALRRRRSEPEGA